MTEEKREFKPFLNVSLEQFSTRFRDLSSNERYVEVILYNGRRAIRKACYFNWDLPTGYLTSAQDYSIKYFRFLTDTEVKIIEFIDL